MTDRLKALENSVWNVRKNYHKRSYPHNWDLLQEASKDQPVTVLNKNGGVLFAAMSTVMTRISGKPLTTLSVVIQNVSFNHYNGLTTPMNLIMD